MAKKLHSYNMIVAHSADTNDFVKNVKVAVDEFCKTYTKYNTLPLAFEVQDFNDAMYSTAEEKDTQEIVFEQFAGGAEIAIVLIGNYIGESLKKEIESFRKEKKQTFLYMYDGKLSVYRDFGKALDSLNKVKEIVDSFENRGFFKVFGTEEELERHIKDDLIRFIHHRQSVKFDLTDKSYQNFAFDEIDRYRVEIKSLVNRLINNKDGKEESGEQKNEWDCFDTCMIARLERHCRTNILELLRVLRRTLSDDYDIEMTDITVSFVWGYHNVNENENVKENENAKEKEVVIIPSPENIITLNHSGTPAKLVQLLEAPNCLLRRMLIEGKIFEWYQYKSEACSKNRYWWPDYESEEKEQCMKAHGFSNCLKTTQLCSCCKTNGDASQQPNENKEGANQTKEEKSNTGFKDDKIKGSFECLVEDKRVRGNFECISNDIRIENKENNDKFGGSIFCYRIVLNGDASSTNNYAVGYIMVSTYKKQFTNSTHDYIVRMVKDSIKATIDHRIKPQLLVELAQLYILNLEKKSYIKEESPASNQYKVDNEYEDAKFEITKEYKEWHHGNKKLK